jgi:hypothetical protein
MRGSSMTTLQRALSLVTTACSVEFTATTAHDLVQQWLLSFGGSRGVRGG